MSEPYWSALGGGVVDYEGAWAAGTQYVPGDVVRYNGVDYLAVNPSLGVNPGVAVGVSLSPPLVTALPASPVDGQEVILVDSLAFPTYQWHFRWLLSKYPNHWIFLGGAPLRAFVATQETTTTVNSYIALTTPGPIITIPVAGDYEVTVGCDFDNASLSTNRMSYDIGATPATDFPDCALHRTRAPGERASGHQHARKSLAAVALTAKYKIEAGQGYWSNRYLQALPIAVGG